MNKHDRDNFNYILHLSNKEFDRWLDSISEDEQIYALEIIRRGRAELLEQEQELLAAEDLSLANKVLAQFRL